MPNREYHKAISKIFVGEDGDKIHEFMDMPSKWLGKHHRNYFHDRATVLALALLKGGKAAQHAALHIFTDKAVSEADKQIKKAVRTGLKSFMKKIQQFRER